jgi:hypothetical protein
MSASGLVRLPAREVGVGRCPTGSGRIEKVKVVKGHSQYLRVTRKLQQELPLFQVSKISMQSGGNIGLQNKLQQRWSKENAQPQMAQSVLF